MEWQSLLKDKALTVYSLSQKSGVPKTTIIDICSGKSAIEKCTGKTIQQLASALGCSMEDVMRLRPSSHNAKTGLPKDEGYLEKGLPSFLEKSLNSMKQSWAIEDSGQSDPHWDIYWCDLNADINAAETDQLISSRQAWYLREKYLRIKREDS